MSPSAKRAKARGYSFPRVSGDEPITLSNSTRLRAFSPRERG